MSALQQRMSVSQGVSSGSGLGLTEEVSIGANMAAASCAVVASLPAGERELEVFRDATSAFTSELCCVDSEVRARCGSPESKQPHGGTEVKLQLLSVHYTRRLIDLLEAHSQPRPFWSALWPSSSPGCLLLLHLARTGWLQGKAVLDVGCGVGMVGVLAAKLGADRVVLADNQRGAVQLAHENASRNGVSGVCSAVCLDWQQLELWPAGFDLVVAADVLYDDAHFASLFPLFGHVLAPGGSAVLVGGTALHTLTSPLLPLLRSPHTQDQAGACITGTSSSGASRPPPPA